MPTLDADAAQAYGRDLLLGDLVRLRPLEERDLLHLERWWGDPEWQVFQQQTVRPQPDGPAQDLFRRWSTNDSGAGVGFSVETRASGEFVGHVTLWGAALPARAATLGIIIGPTQVGRGYGTDAVRTLCRYGFRAMGLHRIGLSLAAFNERGRAAYEKAGFQVEGVRREAVFTDGGFTDEVLMGLLRRDWEAREEARAAEASA
ncbi:GNAT family N-acetyltransferase [Amnibacterium kyonggiense]|uniref:RimJ/RimL family protein N-acetyltransferase n=1 Tax=Amnibacterium kyonggiense TaxID=595671 RepID=A0A4R7FKC8_9MICO|nr:GNAT family protein [Amnibacterium kyonggiense]TDS76798.1 RimJ/RimL family protein N-acetyltransferase [Amnibacterium kyonggiense]